MRPAATFLALRPIRTKTRLSTCASLRAMQTDLRPWHAPFPCPRTNNLIRWTPAHVLGLLRDANLGSSHTPDFVLIDLRREDRKGGTIRGSLNFPAQSLYPALPTLYKILNASGIQNVIWYCGSSLHRGSRAAAWFADYIVDHGDDRMKSVVLAGGIKAWVGAGGEHIDYVDGYDPIEWHQPEQL